MSDVPPAKSAPYKGNHAVPAAYSGGRGKFIMGIQAGMLVKSGALWCATHRAVPVNRHQPMPDHYWEQLQPRLLSALQAESLKPTPTGKGQVHLLACGPVPTYKWLDTQAPELNGVLGFQFPGHDANRIELTTRGLFGVTDQTIYHRPLPPELQNSMKDIFDNTSNSYKNKSVGNAVATGNTEAALRNAQPHVRYVVGIDEAGRGSLAGPMMAGAVWLDLDNLNPLFMKAQDSKGLTRMEREALYKELQASGIFFAAGQLSATAVSGMNLDEANTLVMEQALAGVVAQTGRAPDAVLIDGAMQRMLRIPNSSLHKKGEQHSRAIAMASIVAKVTHDFAMDKLAEQYPQYDFTGNQGYGTPSHLKALEKFGPCDIHRTSFKPIRDMLRKLGKPVPTVTNDSPQLPLL